MLKKSKTILFLVIALTLGVFVYKSPDEAWWHRENTQEAIKIGRRYAFYLLNGYKDGLLRISTEPAKTKVINSNFRSLSFVEMDEQLEKKKIHISLTAPLYEEQKDENMELITLEKLESFIVMTFAYKSWDKIAEIPEKGKMLFSVAVRYYNPLDGRLVFRLIRKIVNLPFLHNFTGNLGTTGRWVVFDYNYKYNSADYFDWLLKYGEGYSNKQLEESERFLEDEQSFDKFDESVDSGLDFLYEWGVTAIKGQPDRFNKLSIMLQEAQGCLKVEGNKMGD